ncbi:MAG TPA: hypothetical protein VGB85_16785 [Nannocystis sp.]|jgi:hypothetical protein
MSTAHRVRSGVVALAWSLLTLAGCPGNGDTDPVTTTDTTGQATTTVTGTTGATDPGVTTGADTDPGASTTTTAGMTTTGASTTGAVTTTATTTTETSGAESGCEPSPCEPCPKGCTPQSECVAGEWTCECIDCPPEVACNEDPPVFPDFDESCGVAEDCAIVFHQIDCCGSKAAWGVNADVAKAFGDAEAMCVMQYNQCDCPTLPPVADDGKSAEDPALIQVDCNDGQCQTYVP